MEDVGHDVGQILWDALAKTNGDVRDVDGYDLACRCGFMMVCGEMGVDGKINSSM